MDGNNEYNFTVKELIKNLTEREKEIMILYYCGNFTMKEIGTALDRVESRISQIHDKCIRKLQLEQKIYE